MSDDWYARLVRVADPRAIDMALERASGYGRYRQWRAYARVCAAGHIDPDDRAAVLESVYGDWTDPGALPTGSLTHTKVILGGFLPSRQAGTIEREEYRRLDARVPERKLVCVDLEGLVIEHGRAMPAIVETIGDVRREHGVVVSTAMPDEEATELIARAGLEQLLPVVFGDLGAPTGKRYEPIARHYGFAEPGRKLVAVSHAVYDRPADIAIPFLVVRCAGELREALRAPRNS